MQQRYVSGANHPVVVLPCPSHSDVVLGGVTLESSGTPSTQGKESTYLARNDVNIITVESDLDPGRLHLQHLAPQGEHRGVAGQLPGATCKGCPRKELTFSGRPWTHLKIVD